MASLAHKISSRIGSYRAPLPLDDFGTYDGYWAARATFKSDSEVLPRWQIAVDKIPDGATVLDVGCGTGGFLKHLRGERPNVTACGIDITPSGVSAARDAGFDARVANLENETITGVFDFITCFETIEHVHEAERMLVAMRDAFTHQLIMSLPNFGYVEHRVRLGVFGRFPNTNLLLHQKEHIRHWTAKDFEDWTAHFGLRVTDIQGQWGMPHAPWARWPQWWSPQVVYTLEHASG